LDDLNFTDGQSSVCELDDAILLAGNVNDGNNGYYRVTEVDEDHLAVKPKEIVAETSPADATLTRGNSFNVGEVLSTEIAGIGTIIITSIGTKIAQKVRNGHTVGWTIDAVEIPLRRVGEPTDSVRLNIRSDSGGVPGTLLQFTEVIGMNIGIEAGTERFQLQNTLTFPAGTTSIWLELQRTGANSVSDFYVVEVDEELSYERGNLLVWDGPAVSWLVRSPDAQLVFRILGAWEATEQISQIVAECGQFVDTVDIIDTTSVYTHQWRDGTTYAYDEIISLLQNTRTVTGLRLLATCTVERILRIQAQPADTEELYLLTKDGEFLTNTRERLEEGVLPVGHWIHMADLPPVVATHYRLSPKFLDKAEYDATTGEIRPTWQGEPDVWEDVDD
jgi:hypothetical protein